MGVLYTLQENNAAKTSSNAVVNESNRTNTWRPSRTRAMTKNRQNPASFFRRTRQGPIWLAISAGISCPWTFASCASILGYLLG